MEYQTNHQANGYELNLPSAINYQTRTFTKDPTNLYHARAPRFRLMGEFVRDNALAISGLLNREFGGPG